MPKRNGWRLAAALGLLIVLVGAALAAYDAIWPRQSGTNVLTSKSLVVDASNASQGYIMARGDAGNKRLKLRVTQGQYKLTYDLLADVVEEECRDAAVSGEDKALIAEFYKYGFVGMMLHWIDGGMKADYRELVQRLSTMLRGSILNAARNFEQKQSASLAKEPE